VLLPAQIVAVPLTVAVGFGLTVNSAVVESTVPQAFVNCARYCLPLSLKVGVKL
jgi:hypothetical protein